MFYWFIYDVKTLRFVSAVLSSEGSPDGWTGMQEYVWVETDLETGDQFLADFAAAQEEIAAAEVGL